MRKRCKTGNTGGAEGNRTPDLVIANDALYQLSYGPIQSWGISAGDLAMQRHGWGKWVDSLWVCIVRSSKGRGNLAGDAALGVKDSVIATNM